MVLLGVDEAEVRGRPTTLQSRPWPRTCPESDRFGWSLVVNWIDAYEVGLLGAGWYHNFSMLAFPPDTAGLGFAQTIRLDEFGPYSNRACAECPTWQSLKGLTEVNPGSLWVIGNEIDAPAQDYLYPDRYAELYHDFYHFLKSVDSTAQVAIAGVVQPTPIRLQYLDLVLAAYQGQYGAPMPIDVFNTHNYILREKRWYQGCPDCWGCQIPLGIEANEGQLFELEDHYNFQIWTEQLIRMRTWMRDRGYRDRPLIVTEYGVLFYDGLGGCTPEITQEFMRDGFDWMRTYTDPDIGYPSDGNRLVQAWNWYSLDHAGEFNDQGQPVWLGLSHLFDPDTYLITDLGAAYAAYTAGLASPSVELVPTSIRLHQSPPGPGDLITATVTAGISNWGKDLASSVLVRFEGSDLPTQQISVPSIAPGQTEHASVQWTGLSLGDLRDITVTVDPERSILECNHANNSRSAPLLVGSHWVYLPKVSRYR